MRLRLICCVVVGLAVCWAPPGDARAAGFPSVFHGGATVDVNSHGEAVVAWDGVTGVRAVVGDRAGGLGVSVLLSAATDTLSSPQVAIDDRGDVIVVWETYRQAPGSHCSTCGAHLISDGVWAS